MMHFHQIDTQTTFNLITLLSGDITISIKYNPELLPDLDLDFNFFYLFKGLINSTPLEKTSDIVSQFCSEAMINNLNHSFYIPKIMHECGLNDFNFISQCFNIKVLFLHVVFLLLSNRLLQILLLCTVVYLMQTISALVCYDNKLGFCTNLSSRGAKNVYISQKEPKPVKTKKPFYFITGVYNYIISLTYWIYQHIHMNSYKKLHEDILLKIYENVKGLISLFSHNYRLVKLPYSAKIEYVISIPNVMVFAMQYLNTVYAALTVVYILLGWILDYLSFMWIFYNNGTEFEYIFTLAYWIKHLLYAMLYITWLNMGVFTTNGIYFLILDSAINVNNLNIIMAITGSIMSIIASNLWYLYGQATIPEIFNIFSLIKNEIFWPLLLIQNQNFDLLRRIFSVINYWLFSAVSFNLYSTLRRSIIEWIAFLGMVFSTYGTWNLYMLNIFYSLSIIQNLMIWVIPTFISGYILIYLEESRPVFSNYYYGFVYLLFWTCICFSTNTILVGYISINNALSFLNILLPINFSFAFIYLIPLYRSSLHLSTLSRILHLFCFVLLAAITLLTAGTIWYLIAPM